MIVHLRLCDRCRDAVLSAPVVQHLVVDGFVQLPPLCAECGGKVSQVVRILLTNGIVNVEQGEKL